MKNRFLCGAAFVAALGYAGAAQAQDRAQENAGGSSLSTLPDAPAHEILVTAGRSDDLIAVEDFTGSAIVISRAQIEQRQTRNIADILRDVPGVAVSEVAGQTQIRLRGAEANQVLVLVDGIEVSDPFAGEFDIGTLQAEIGSSLEVLRGPQSALYGSDAIGGVVAYQSGTGTGVEARAEIGTLDTFNGSLRAGKFTQDWDFSVAATAVSTDGEPNARDGVRDIGRDSYTFSGKGSVALSGDFSLRAAGRYIRTEGDFNDSDFDTTSPTFGLTVDSPGTRFENDAIYALVGAKLETLNGAWSHDLSAQIADINRDTFTAFGRSSGSEGDRLKASYVSAFSFGEVGSSHNLTFAADWERERFRNDDPFGFASALRQQIENIGLVGEYRYAGERFDFSAALRHDINDRFADETTFRIGAGFDVTGSTRLRASAGSGIKNPGFFELFGFFDGQFIGNEDLQPERSIGWEFGIDQTFADDAVRISATYFQSELENEIFTIFPAPDFVATPINSDAESERSGIELSVWADLGSGFSLTAAYSFLDAEEDGIEEVRRPDHIASTSLDWVSPDDVFAANLTVRYNGETEDLAFTDPSFIPVRVTLDDFALVNFNVSAQLTDRIEVFGRAENLLNDRFEQVFSFVSPGRSAEIGIATEF
ncbi:MAG: TonB-dependent receptor [Erythrobacter sp.]